MPLLTRASASARNLTMLSPWGRLARGRLLALPLVVLGLGCADPDFDLILAGGTVVDGSGAPTREADVGIVDGRIARVGDLSGATAAERVDVGGLHVAPGFVNLHSHGGRDGLASAENLLAQGVTTVLLNADGGGPVELGPQLEEIEALGPAVNVGANIGFNAVWSEVVGPEDRRPTAEELAAMWSRIERGLQSGAWGISAGLDYKPAYFARTDEVVSALAGVGRWRTVFTNHDRLTPESGFSSRLGMAETIEIGTATGLMPLITHMKVQGHEQGTVDAVLEMMREAGERGIYTAADAYPYLAGQTSLAALIVPGWAQEGGSDAMRTRFADPELRARIVLEADEAMSLRFGGPEGVYLPTSGRELTDVMEELGVETGGEAVVALLEDENPTAILRFGAESDLVGILRHPAVSVACDCDATDGRPGHPRAWGTFPRVLGRYVREQGVLSLEEAVRKMSGLPAVTVGMVDRGFLAPGMAADVVVFDASSVMDHATYEDPGTRPDGIVHVLVGGTWALRDGSVTGSWGGRVLRRDPSMPARPMSDTQRQLVLDGPLDPMRDGTVSVEASLEQAADETTAGGTLVVTVDGDRMTATDLGRLDVHEDWASIGAWSETETGERRFVRVIVDGSDPRDEPGMAPRVTVWVDDDPVGVARAPGGLTIRAELPSR